eukprot:TRINITY_DN1913_c0_g1_i3.p1 TRINITY_DN1913_c0_g1~~TRINITY_DN1913_c0_g1_i3.p1  ORF type:complete len:2637 (+),score=877.51 TRINITY_DN1913_c0_g1_i3:1780-9690(+)
MAMLPVEAVYDDSLRPLPRGGGVDELLKDDEEWFNIPPVVKAAFRSMQGVIRSLESRLDAAVHAAEVNERAAKAAMGAEVARRTDGVAAKMDRGLDDLSDRIADLDNAMQRKIEKLDANIRTVNERVQRRATFKATLEKEVDGLRTHFAARLDEHTRQLPKVLEKWAGDAPPALEAAFDHLHRAKQGRIAEQARGVVEDYVAASPPALVKMCNDAMQRWGDEKFPGVFVAQLRAPAAEKAVLGAVDTYCSTAPPALTRMVRNAARQSSEEDFPAMFSEELRSAASESAIRTAVENWVLSGPDAFERQCGRAVAQWDKAARGAKERFVTEVIDKYFAGDAPPLLVKHCNDLIQIKAASVEHRTAVDDQIKRTAAEWVAAVPDEFKQACGKVVSQHEEARGRSVEYQRDQANTIKHVVEDWLAPVGAGGEPPRAFAAQCTRVVAAWNEARVQSEEYLARQAERIRQVVAGWIAALGDDFTKPCLDVMTQWGSTTLPLLLERHLAPGTSGGGRVVDHIEAWAAARPASLTSAVVETYRGELEGGLHGWVVAKVEEVAKRPPAEEHVLRMVDDWADARPPQVARMVHEEWCKHAAAVEKQRPHQQREAVEQTKHLIEEYVASQPPSFASSCTAVVETWAERGLAAAMAKELTKNAGVERAVSDRIEKWWGSSATVAAVGRTVDAVLLGWADQHLGAALVGELKKPAVEQAVHSVVEGWLGGNPAAPPASLGKAISAALQAWSEGDLQSLLPAELKKPPAAAALVGVVEAWLAESASAAGTSPFKRAVLPVVQGWAEESFPGLWGAQLRAPSASGHLRTLFEEFLGGGDGGGANPALRRAVHPLQVSWAEENFAAMFSEHLRGDAATVQVEAVIESLFLTIAQAAASLQGESGLAGSRRGSVTTSSACIAFRRAAAPVIQQWAEEHYGPMWRAHLLEDTTTQHLEAAFDAHLLGTLAAPVLPPAMATPVARPMSPLSAATATPRSTPVPGAQPALKRAVEPLVQRWVAEHLPSLFAEHLRSGASHAHLTDTVERYLAGGPVALTEAVQPVLHAWAEHEHPALWAAELAAPAYRDHLRQALGAFVGIADGADETLPLGTAEDANGGVFRAAARGVVEAWAEEEYAARWADELSRDRTDAHIAGAVEAFLRHASGSGGEASPTMPRSPLSPGLAPLGSPPRTPPPSTAARVLQDAVTPVVAHYFTAHFTAAWQKELSKDANVARVANVVDTLHTSFADALLAPEADRDRGPAAAPFARAAGAVVQRWAEEHFRPLWAAQLQQPAATAQIAGAVEACLSATPEAAGHGMYTEGRAAQSLRAATERVVEGCVAERFAGWFGEELRKDASQGRIASAVQTTLHGDAAGVYLDRRFEAALRGEASAVYLDGVFQRFLRSDVSSAHLDACFDRALQRQCGAGGRLVEDISADVLAGLPAHVAPLLADAFSERFGPAFADALRTPAAAAQLAGVLQGWCAPSTVPGADPAASVFLDALAAAMKYGRVADGVREAAFTDASAPARASSPTPSAASGSERSAAPHHLPHRFLKAVAAAVGLDGVADRIRDVVFPKPGSGEGGAEDTRFAAACRACVAAPAGVEKIQAALAPGLRAAVAEVVPRVVLEGEVLHAVAGRVQECMRADVVEVEKEASDDGLTPEDVVELVRAELPRLLADGRSAPSDAAWELRVAGIIDRQLAAHAPARAKEIAAGVEQWAEADLPGIVDVCVGKVHAASHSASSSPIHSRSASRAATPVSPPPAGAADAVREYARSPDFAVLLSDALRRCDAVQDEVHKIISAARLVTAEDLAVGLARPVPPAAVLTVLQDPQQDGVLGEWLVRLATATPRLAAVCGRSTAPPPAGAAAPGVSAPSVLRQVHEEVRKAITDARLVTSEDLAAALARPAPAPAPPSGAAAQQAEHAEAVLRRLQDETAAAARLAGDLRQVAADVETLAVSAVADGASAARGLLADAVTQQLQQGLLDEHAREWAARQAENQDAPGRRALRSLAATVAATQLQRLQSELVDSTAAEARTLARAHGGAYAAQAVQDVIAAMEAQVTSDATARLTQAADMAARSAISTQYLSLSSEVADLDAEVRRVLAQHLKERAHGIAADRARAAVVAYKPDLVACLDARVQSLLAEAEPDLRRAVEELTVEAVRGLAEEDLLPIVAERAAAARERVVLLECGNVMKAARRDVDVKITAALEGLLDRQILADKLRRSARDGFGELRERFSKDLKAKVNSLVSREVGSEWLTAQVDDMKDDMRTRLLAGENETLDVAVGEQVARHAGRLVDAHARSFKNACRAALKETIQQKAAASAREVVAEAYQQLLPEAVDENWAEAEGGAVVEHAVKDAMHERVAAAVSADAGSTARERAVRTRASETLEGEIRQLVASCSADHVRAGVEEWINAHTNLIAGRVLPLVINSVESAAGAAVSPAPTPPHALREAVVDLLASDRAVREEMRGATRETLLSDSGIWHTDVRAALHTILGSMDLSAPVQKALQRQPPSEGITEAQFQRLLREACPAVLREHLEPMRSDLEATLTTMIRGKADEAWVRDVLESKLDSSAALYELIRLENAKTNRIEAQELLNQKANQTDVVEHLNQRPLRAEVQAWLQELRDELGASAVAARRQIMSRSASGATSNR